MQMVYNGWAQSRIDYVSCVYNPGSASLLQPITNAANSFWKICSSDEPHPKYVEPRIRLIINDLVQFHKMAIGKSALDFETMFKTPSPLDPQEILKKAKFRDNKIIIPKLRLTLSRQCFNFRVRPYWNLLPNEIKIMKEAKFKTEIKEHILKNKQLFLNIGLKDYNIVGGTTKQVRKKNGIPSCTSKKYKKWTLPTKNPTFARRRNQTTVRKKNQPKPDTNDWIWDWDKLKRLK